MMRNTYLFILISTLTLPFLLSCQTIKVDNTPTSHLDLNRYLGQWYEIARFDHSFERGMTQTRAEYKRLDNGHIQVINSGIKNGIYKTSIGNAKTTHTTAVLRVSFFGPFYNDYRILMLDENYQYALIGGSSDQYLWILARMPLINDTVKAAILSEAQRRGYNINNFIWVEHDLSDLEIISREEILWTPNSL